MDTGVDTIERAPGVDISLQDITSSPDARNLKRRARYNGYPLLKQVLVDAIKGYVRIAKKKGGAKTDIVLSITMPCGSSVNYKTYDDIPDKDVPCSCGDEKHYLIRYRDLR